MQFSDYYKEGIKLDHQLNWNMFADKYRYSVTAMSTLVVISGIVPM
jgi:hypothetical protein